MDITLHSLFALMRLTLTDPREGVRRVKATAIDPPVVWQAFVLVVIVSVLVVELSTALAPPPPEGGALGALFVSPFAAGLFQGIALFLTATAMHRIGAAFGGVGSFDDALKIVVWIEVMLIALQVVQAVTLLVLPPLVPLIFLAALAWSLWMLTAAVMELHGFVNPLKVFLGILGSSIAIGFALLVVLAILNAFGIITIAGPPDV